MDHQSTAAYIIQNQEKKPKEMCPTPPKKDDETNDNGERGLCRSPKMRQDEDHVVAPPGKKNKKTRRPTHTHGQCIYSIL